MDVDWSASDLRHFLDDAGRLMAYPAKRKRKVLALCYLASKLEAGRRYTEAEVNEVIMLWHNFADWAMLRRELVVMRLIERTDDGSAYWLADQQPTLADLGM
jgi:hypothetical protein